MPLHALMMQDIRSLDCLDGQQRKWITHSCEPHVWALLVHTECRLNTLQAFQYCNVKRAVVEADWHANAGQAARTMLAAIAV